MNFWLVLTVNSVTFGGLLFLLSAGFSLIFGLMRIPNLTHGSMFMLGAYLGSTLITADDWLAHPGSVGKPMMGGVHILDEEGNELPPGQAGEIYFAGGYDFEYLNDEAKTAASRQAEC